MNIIDTPVIICTINRDIFDTLGMCKFDRNMSCLQLITIPEAGKLSTLAVADASRS